ncbi:MAG: DUF885 family protein [Dokdonella sp.]
MATASTQPAVQDKAEQLDALYEEYWEEVLKRSPVSATFQGDPRYNDQLVDSDSAENRAKTHEFDQRWLDRVTAIGDAGLSGQALLSYQIFVRERQDDLAGEQYPFWMMPVNQMNTTASMAVLLGSGAQAQPFKTVRDYDNWFARASLIPGVFDTEIGNMRAGMAAGVVQPRELMVKVVPQLNALIKDRPEDTQFWGPITNMPADFSPAERQRLTTAYQQLIADRLMPAYRKLRDFVRDDYLPKTRSSYGIDKLPNGAAWYAYLARQGTTTDLTPAAIHQSGLDEVARIHGEIQQVMKQVGFKGSMTKFFAFMQKDKRFEFKSEAALLDHYRQLEATIESHIPEQFSLVPKAKFEIRAVEAFRAESAAGGEYMSPSEDGTRAGIFYVNTFDLPTRKTWDSEDLFLHEAIPGHHFQIALQQELTNIPKFRRFGGNNAFVEGWALYAEGLGKDLGVFTDPYSYFGRLQGELWRAVRLVVDTGLHSKGWTRQQVIDYMHANSSVSTPDAIAEAERYIAWPGQALGYKIGELTIKRLRAKAEAELGPKFDIREFHAEVIKDGAVPLGILEDKIGRWIESKKAS